MFKTGVKYRKACYKEKNIVKYRTCAYWIHDKASCYNFTLKYGKYCLNCYYTQMSNVEDDNNQGKINGKHRKYNVDDDDIWEFHTNVNSDNSEGSKTQTFVSESCNTFFNKLNQNK